MKRRQFKKLVCAILSVVVAVAPTARIASAQQSAAANASGGLADANMLEAARKRERQVYLECRSESLKRAYRFSAQIASLRYALRANLAMHLELVNSVTSSDLLTVDQKSLDSSALHLFNRTIETLVLSMTWASRPWSDIDRKDIKDVAKALDSHIRNDLVGRLPNDTDRAAFNGTLAVLRQMATDGDPQGPVKIIQEQVAELRTTPKPTAEAVSKQFGVTKEQANEWVTSLKTLEDEEKTLGDKLSRTPKIGDKEMDGYLKSVDVFLKSPVTRELLKQLGIKGAERVKEVTGAIGHGVAAIMGIVTLISKWDQMSDKDKVLMISRTLVEGLLAIQVFMSAATAGIKTGILLALALLLDFLDIGLSLFPDGDGSKPPPGEGPEPGGEGFGDPEVTRNEDDKGGGGEDKATEKRPPAPPKGVKDDRMDDERTRARKRYDASLNKELVELRKQPGETDAEKKHIKEREDALRGGAFSTEPREPINFTKRLMEDGIDENSEEAVDLLLKLRQTPSEITDVKESVNKKAQERENRRREALRTRSEAKP